MLLDESSDNSSAVIRFTIKERLLWGIFAYFLYAFLCSIFAAARTAATIKLVVKGIFCFLGKTTTMLGSPESSGTLGIIPCAISWLFRGIHEQKQKTGARFSVRVSAVEVCQPSQQLKDLLAGHANGKLKPAQRKFIHFKLSRVIIFTDIFVFLPFCLIPTDKGKTINR